MRVQTQEGRYNDRMVRRTSSGRDEERGGKGWELYILLPISLDKRIQVGYTVIIKD